MPTDRLFTGQRLDNTGLYYYGARYYDPTIGRFISADTVGQHLTNPQTLNRYSYVANNPLRYTDLTGHDYVEDYWGNVYWSEPGETYNPYDNPAFNNWLYGQSPESPQQSEPDLPLRPSQPIVPQEPKPSLPIVPTQPEPEAPEIPELSEAPDNEVFWDDFNKKGLEVTATVIKTYDWAHMAVPFVGSIVIVTLGGVVASTGIGAPVGVAIAAYGMGGLITASGIFSAYVVAYGAHEWWRQEQLGEEWKRVFGR